MEHSLRNRDILVTQLRLNDYAGSEIVTLELVEYFSRRVRNVYILTTSYDYPIKSDFEKLNNVHIYNINDDSANDIIKKADIAIAWIHHQMIPNALLEEPNNTKFVFHHMSPYAEFEFPFSSNIENTLADKILCNSAETRDEFLSHKLFTDPGIVEIFNNPAPQSFNVKSNPNGQLKSVLVVSNHVPEEVRQASLILEKQNINVSFIGAQDSAYKRLTVEDLEEYDTILTIGKTVQYCIVNQRPVYCYDRFGGPGYISQKNYHIARDLNFSGRGFAKKDPVIIASELIENYDDACKYIKVVYKKDLNTFLLESRMQKLFADLDIVRAKKIKEADIHVYKTLKYLIFKKVPSLHKIEREYASKELLITGLKSENLALKDEVIELQKLKFIINDIKHSKSYRIGRATTAPLRIPKKLSATAKQKIGAYKNLKRINSHIQIIYDFKRGDSRNVLKVGIVIRSIHHPTSSTFIRLISPFANKLLQDVAFIYLIDGEAPQIKPGTDALIIQRTALPNSRVAKDLIENASKKSIKLFVDTDDAFSELDKNHPQYSLQKERVDALDLIIRHAKETWFSTEALMKLYGIKKSRVIYNTLDTKVWTRLRNGTVKLPIATDPLKIVYMGTATHSNDFQMIVPALNRLHDQHPGKFEVHIIGVAQGLQEYPWMREQKPDSALYPDFVKWFNNLEQFDIGLSPLEDTAFNKNKSDIKCLDYLACGIRPVVSDVEAYRNPELNELITRVRNNDEDWYLALENEIIYLDKNRELMQARAEKGFAYIKGIRSTEVAAKSIRESLGINKA